MCRLLGIAVALVITLGCFASIEARISLFAGKDLSSPFFSRYVPPPSHDEPLDFLDKLYKKLDDIKCELKTATEQLDAEEARLGQLRKALREILQVTVEGLNVIEEDQDDLLSDIEAHLEQANTSVVTVFNCLGDVTLLNSNNLYNASDILHILADLRRIDAIQEGRVVVLINIVKEFKDKLLQAIGNEFDLLSDDVADAAGDLSNIRQCEAKKMCETGVVVLNADDGSAQYLYQNAYSSTPMVSYGLSSYTFALDNRPVPDASFGSYIPWQEPNQLGVFVAATPSLTGVSFNMFDKTFGDTAGQKVTVSFTACSIGVGMQSVH